MREGGAGWGWSESRGRARAEGVREHPPGGFDLWLDLHDTGNREQEACGQSMSLIVTDSRFPGAWVSNSPEPALGAEVWRGLGAFLSGACCPHLTPEWVWGEPPTQPLPQGHLISCKCEREARCPHQLSFALQP